MEAWKRIEDTNYEVSSHGRIRHIYKGTILKQGTDVYGYAQVNITALSAKRKRVYKVHRLVALAFLPNPNGYSQINHKDENKKNNVADNLEWCTPKYNLNYGTRNARIAEKKKRPIVGTNVKTGEKIYFNSSKQAGKNGFNYSHVCACLRGERNKTGGFSWCPLRGCDDGQERL